MNLPLTIRLLNNEISITKHNLLLEEKMYGNRSSTYYQEQTDRLNQLKLELNIIENR